MDTKWLENVPGLKDFIVSVVRDEMRKSGGGTQPQDIPTEEPARACNVSADFKPKTMLIGNQVWMQENLAVSDGGEGITYNPDNGQYYYTWDAAMRIAKSIPGWHLPTAEEWNAAAAACGATVADDDYKDNPYMRDYEGTEKLYDTLRVLPVGYYRVGSFNDVGSYAYFWSATEGYSGYAYDRYFVTSAAMGQLTHRKDYGYSVRLVKDTDAVAVPTTESINVMDPATLKQLHDTALSDMAKEAENLDYEAAHSNADNILSGLLRKLGFGDVIDVYDKIQKW